MKQIIESFNHKKKIAQKHVERRLLRRLVFFIVMACVMIAVVVFQIWLQHISVWLALFGAGLGLILGIVVGRMFKMFWHIETEKIVARLDKAGITLLVIYVGIELSRKWFFGHWLHGAQLNAFALAFLVGVLIGRLLSMIGTIQGILIEEKKVEISK